MSRKQKKMAAVKAAGRARYHRIMRNFEAARIQYQKVWRLCGMLAAMGEISQNEWFRSVVG